MAETALSDSVKLVIVKNLPKEWTHESLQKYLQAVASLKIAQIQCFQDFRNTVLVTLKNVLTVDSITKAEKRLRAKPLTIRNDLCLVPVTQPHDSCTVLVQVLEDKLSELLATYFDNVREIAQFEVYGHPSLNFRLFHFARPQDAAAVAGMTHVHETLGELSVELWCEQFHAPLIDLLSKQRKDEGKRTKKVLSKTIKEERFCLEGKLAKRAVKSWLSIYLNEAKSQIEKHGKIVSEVSNQYGYTLRYLLHQKSVDSVSQSLNLMKQAYVCGTVDLHEKFSNPSENARFIKAMDKIKMEPETLTSQLEETLQRQGVTCLVAFTMSRPSAQMTEAATSPERIGKTSVSTRTGAQTPKPNRPWLGHKKDVRMNGRNYSSENVRTSDVLRKDLFQEDFFVAEICTATSADNKKVAELLMKELRGIISVPDYDEILSQNAKLQTKIENMKLTENELRMSLLAQTTEFESKIKTMVEEERMRLKATTQDTLERMTRQAEILLKQITELSKIEIQKMDVAEHHLRLLTDFATTWVGCQIMLLQNDAKVIFFGTDSECQRAKLELSKLIKQIADDSLSVTEPVWAILRTEKGKQHLMDLLRVHSRCSLALLGSSIRCAALNHVDLQYLMTSLKTAFVMKICKVPHSIIQDAQFKVLKGALEEKYLVKINADTADHVVIDGVAGDVEVAARKVDMFTSLNIPGRKEFCIPGALQGKGCQKWFSDTLADATEKIRKNGKILQEVKQDGYKLVFECRKEVLELVLMKLNDIKYGIISTTINLNNAFDTFCDRALVINGLHSHGREAFCKTFLQKLKQKGISCLMDVVVPKEQVLPEFGIPLLGETQRLQRMRNSSRHVDEVQPCYVEDGSCKITITSGDISKSRNDAAVIFVGKDLEVTNTSVGNACFKVFPQLQQELRNHKLTDNNSGSQDFHLFVSELDTKPVVMYAILQHLDEPEKEVERIVTEILKQMESKKLASVSMTPLGVGRRFNFNHEGIAKATVMGIKAVLSAGTTSLKEIALIINERRYADSFSSALSQMIAPVTFIAANDQSEDKAIQTDKVEPVKATSTERFEALFCTKKGDHWEQLIIQALLKELSDAFLWHETERDVDTFEQLDKNVKEKIMKFAKQNKLLVTKSEMGLRISGRKEFVQNLQSEIRKEMYTFVINKSREGEKRRRELGLHVNTDRFPSYWKECESQYETAVKNWNQAGTHTVAVSDEESKAVEQLFLATWKQQVVAAGIDDVKVMKVERLENPVLWRAYSSKRELLFIDLVARHMGASPARCTPVEDISGSRGPVLTTKNIDKTGPLDRQIYHEINEHYFFHGTKAPLIKTICSQGLDFRVGQLGNLGKGVYGAECSEKSNQYVGNFNSKYEMEFVMFLMRMSLGEPYLNTEGRTSLFDQNNRPPCMSCNKTKCTCPNSRLYNSVIHNPTSTFREFVVYDQDVCYPEYLITYRNNP